MDTDTEVDIHNYSMDLLKIHEENPERYPYLLESVANQNDQNRYNILFAFPQKQLVQNKISNNQDADFLSQLNEWYKAEKQEQQNDYGLPFLGGWFLYLGYELAAEIEPVLTLPDSPDLDLPTAMACRIPAAIIVDKVSDKTYLVCEAAYSHYLKTMQEDLAVESEESSVNLADFSLHEDAPEQYINSIQRIKQYIIDGDIFQVNLSRKWQLTSEKSFQPSAIYRRLRAANPAPFSGLAVIQNASIISSSPERLVKISGDCVETRPIAGTRPRVRQSNGEIDEAGDKALLQELISHPKERAEHVMLLDLERNDLGRIAIPGTVEVNEIMGLETYEHVHHIVSNVKATKKQTVLPGDVIRAVFPGGTITGCPKVRCMEIIAELEGEPRHAYTGSLGYLNRNGNMDLNILIRTIIQSGKQLHIRAGGGIVADSDPQKELEEAHAKAKGMLNAVPIKHQG